jgi:dTMP kinase
MQGRLITFEGGEGSGKTTQIKLLSDALHRRQIPHLLTREPGGTVLAERIRPLVVEASDAQEDWHPLAETLLFLAARVQHWQGLIQPALEAGKWVLCDRYIDSTLVYQGIAKGLGVEYLVALHQMVLGAHWQPTDTILLDIPPEKGLARAAARGNQEARFENLALSFHQQLRDGFLGLAKAYPQRYHVISADAPTEAIHQQIVQALELSE